jgi:CDP-4-dehydro-6-deoxyglucose reductase
MFTIRNKIGNKTFTANNIDSVLKTALDNGLKFPYGCQRGFCGKCKAVILEGQVDYKDGIPQGITQEEVDSGMALLCQSVAKSDVLLAVNDVKSSDIEVRSIPCKVDSINRLNHDVIQIFLKIPNSQSLQYLAGQYIDLIHPDFEPKPFSIANMPANSNLIEIHVRFIENGKFTNYIFNQLKAKDILRIEGPKGNFYLRDDSKDSIIMIAGSTGFGPIKAMIEYMIKIKSDIPIHLYWGVREQADFYMDLPIKWANEYKNIKFTLVLSEVDNKSSKYKNGYVHDIVLDDFDDLNDYKIYVCGNPMMVKAAANSFINKGMSKNNFFSDAFEFVFNKK